MTDKPLPPVQGMGRRDGLSPKDIPDGYISWEEHYEAWSEYHKTTPSVSAETIANRGGFTYGNLQELLGRNPDSWVPRDPVKHNSFRFEHDPALEETEEEIEEDTSSRHRSHIWFSGSERPVCRTVDATPDQPFNFDSEDAAHCSKCLRVLHNWVARWINGTQQGERS